MPAVSIQSTGPSGSSSIGFSTGSVVVPAISETIETSCRVIAFSSDDLPALRRPNRPMCRRRPLGVLMRLQDACAMMLQSRIRSHPVSDPSLVTCSGEVNSSNSSAVNSPRSITNWRMLRWPQGLAGDFVGQSARPHRSRSCRPAPSAAAVLLWTLRRQRSRVGLDARDAMPGENVAGVGQQVDAT